jgi:hypothetical protein
MLHASTKELVMRGCNTGEVTVQSGRGNSQYSTDFLFLLRVRCLMMDSWRCTVSLVGGLGQTPEEAQEDHRDAAGHVLG